MTDQQDEITKLRQINSVMIRSIFAHHPNCSQYDHHVLHLGKWRFCLGCTGMYSAILLGFVVDLLVFQWRSLLGMWSRLALGLVFFVPALIQLRWKSSHKSIKFAMRFSLGISIWFLLSTIIYATTFVYQLIFILLFMLGVYLYATSQASKQLLQCEQCRYNQEYDSCLIKFQDLLSIDNLELVEQEHSVIQQVLDLKRRARHDDAILLPSADIH